MIDQKDPHWGKGGRYQVVDGQRVPVTPPAENVERAHPGTGVVMQPIEGDTLTVPSTDKPVKKGK